jgi:signal transduction histidine kinase/DNA-binding response OmpR family regulator
VAKILVVDDHETNRDFLRIVLEHAGHNVSEARDGEEALRAAGNLHPELVISDILMPSMDGREFVRRLRERAEFVAVPILFTSAYYLESEAKSLGQQSGVKDFIPKPCEPERVLAIVAKVLQDSGLESGPPTAANPNTAGAGQPTKTEELRAMQARLLALTEVSRELSQCTDIAELCQKYITAIRHIVAAEAAVVRLAGTNTPTGVFAHSGSCAFAGECGMSRHGAGLQGACLPRLEASQCLTTVLKTKMGTGLGTRTDGGFDCNGFRFHSYMAAPVTSASGIHGWIALFNKIGFDGFRDEDEWLLASVAAQLAVAYHNATLEETNRRSTVALQQTERQLRAIIEHTPDRICLKSIDGEVLLGNPAFDASPRRLPLLPDSGHPTEFEEELETPAGVRTFLSRHFPISDEQGRPYAVCSISTDITQRKSLEQQLAQAQKMEAVGLLAGGVAHDFNNLLAVIQGYSQFALESLAPDHCVVESIREIQTASQRAATLTRQLLVFSRKQILQPKPLALNNLIGDLTKMLQRLIGENIELVFQPGTDLGQVTADPGQIEQVIVNLVVNSRDAMPRGGKLTVRTENVFLDEDFMQHHSEIKHTGPNVMISVTDAGCGMTPEVQARAFEPFFTTKPKGQGTGLGLATVYGIVKQSGGYIWLYSESGVGTTIKVYLPRTGVFALIEGKGQDLQVQGGTETVLVAEDEPALRKLVCSVLRKQGYHVLEAKDGADGLRKFHESARTVDLLFTDVLMPDMGGRELADTVRQERPSTRVMFMTGYAGENIAGQIRLDAHDHIIQKPFSPTDMARAVRAVLDQVELVC